LIVSLDDSGGKSTGILQSSMILAIDNLTGSNDIFNLTFNNDAERKRGRLGTQTNSIYYSVPQKYWRFNISAQENNYHQTIHGLYTNYVLAGKSYNINFNIDRLLSRNQSMKTSLRAGVIKKGSSSYIDDEEIEVQRKNTTAVELAVDNRRYYGRNVLYSELAYRQGVPWLGAQREEKSANDIPTTLYKLWTLHLNWVHPTKIGSREVVYTAKFGAQRTKNLLYSSDFLSIGNRYIVRGFDGEQSLCAENGWYIRNELDIPIMKKHNIYLGLDHGQVVGPSDEWLLGRSLTGAVLGLRGNRGNKGTFNYDVFAGWPISKPKGYKTANPTYGFYINYKI
jgi:hemolysin activation/secretion protein